MDVSALITSVAGAADLARLLVQERDRQKAATIEIDLTNKIAQAQMQITQVLGAIIEKDGLIQTLTERVRELESEQSEKARYQLAKVGTVGDFFAYKLRTPAELAERSDELPHFLCQPCLDIRKHRSVLQLSRHYAKCTSCNTSLQIELLPTRQARSSTSVLRRDW